MQNLLLFTEVDESFTTTVTYVAIGLICAAVLAICAGFAFKKNAMNTKAVVYGGITIAASFVLSFIRFAPVTYGGSITLASLLPVLIYAYCFGFFRALAVGIIYGLLQFIQDPYILTPLAFILDYILAFACISLMAIPSKKIKSPKGAFVSGIALCYAGRFLMHLLSGIIYFEMGAIWTNLPQNNAFVYSALYQLVYLVPDCIVCLVAYIAAAHSKSFINLLESIKQ